MSKDFCINTILEDIFNTLTEVPSFPKVVQKALAMLDDSNATVKDIVEVLRYDQGITASILQLTNSAHFGLPQQVTSLDTALALLGQTQLRQILIASASLPYLTRPLPGYGLTSLDLWSHSIGCAVTAEAIAHRLKYSDPSILFTAGILHDIGKVVLSMYVSLKLQDIKQVASEKNLTFMEAEWNILGTDHAVIGYELLKYWEFPRDLARAVRNHHDPDLYIQNDMSAILSMANIICALLGIGVGFDAYLYNIPDTIMDKLDIGQKDIDLFMMDALNSMKKVEDILSIN